MPMGTSWPTSARQPGAVGSLVLPDGLPVTRRQWLMAAAAASFAPAWAATPERPTRLVAAWQTPSEHRIGVLTLEDTRWSVQQSLAVPTRAHGLLAEPGGSVLAAARRPGDWLLRWHPQRGDTQWQWVEDDRRFNGHAVTSANGQTLWTTETDQDSAAGLLAVRDARSLAKQAEWPTGGMDPHQLMRLPEDLGALPAGALVVANGGIPTLAETGRAKRSLDRMDPSLAVLDPRDGRLLGQWRLTDPYLSIRHLAWDPVSRTLGIALQAEHPEAALRQAAPVLAVWDGRALRTASGQPPVQGYGGDICARPGGGFVVSCPRVNALALFDTNASWLQAVPHQEAYALATRDQRWWASGADGVLLRVDADAVRNTQATPDPSLRERVQIDNHWVTA